jgi:hypothetical protein
MDQSQSPLAHASGVVIVVLLGLSITNGAARAQAVGSGHARPHSLGVAKPRIDLTQPADSTDFTQQLSHDLNGVYDQYLASKTTIQNDYNIQFSMPVSVFGQWGTPNGRPGVAELVYSPSLTWTPFTNTAIGSGAFNFAFQQNQFWTGANTNSQQGSMGLITAPNDWGANGYQLAQITWTQTLPGKLLAVSAGQYSFGQYDGNQYAGNAQANFINYALAQNATQTYANAGVGAYLQINPNRQLQFAGGMQGATNITGETVTTSGYRNNQIAYFLSRPSRNQTG